MKLPLADAVTVEDDARWLEACGAVEMDKQLTHHGGQLVDHFLPVFLHSHGCRIATGVSVHAAHHLLKGREGIEPKQRRQFASP